MYPPQDPAKFEKALSESIDSRISEEQRNAILKLYLDGEWDRLRSKIASVSNPKSETSKMGVVGKMLVMLKVVK
jgi:DNA-binding transcriptional regulator/RsmH inhibitor MraZ